VHVQWQPLQTVYVLASIQADDMCSKVSLGWSVVKGQHPAAELGKTNGDRRQVLLAHDTRPSAPGLVAAAAAGVEAVGCTPVQCGEHVWVLAARGSVPPKTCTDGLGCSYMVVRSTACLPGSDDARSG
jgi:hypothetical protein